MWHIYVASIHITFSCTSRSSITRSTSHYGLLMGAWNHGITGKVYNWGWWTRTQSRGVKRNRM